jgi:hypothetical protein
MLFLAKILQAVNWKVSGWSIRNEECKKTEVHENWTGKNS